MFVLENRYTASARHQENIERPWVINFALSIYILLFLIMLSDNRLVTAQVVVLFLSTRLRVHRWCSTFSRLLNGTFMITMPGSLVRPVS